MSHVTLSFSPHRAASILLEPPRGDVAVPGVPRVCPPWPRALTTEPTERTYVSLKEGSSRRSLWNNPFRPDVPSPSLLPERGAWRAGRQRL